MFFNIKCLKLKNLVNKIYSFYLILNFTVFSVKKLIFFIFEYIRSNFSFISYYCTIKLTIHKNFLSLFCFSSHKENEGKRTKENIRISPQIFRCRSFPLAVITGAKFCAYLNVLHRNFLSQFRVFICRMKSETLKCSAPK